MKLNTMEKIIDPKISIIMSVYNSEKFLEESIESLLEQTFKYFELIITDDCSTDNSEHILEGFSKRDPRIILIKNIENIGLTKNLNKMIAIAKGKYIARMDSDDISVANRLETQFNFMENNSQIGVLGADGKIFGEKRNSIFINRPQFNNEIKAAFFFENLLVHSSVFIRRSIIKEFNILYDENFRIIQDYELWVRMTEFTKFHILPKILVLYRVSDTNISNTTKIKENYRQDILKRIHEYYFIKNNFIFNCNQLNTHIDMIHKNQISDILTFSEIENWLGYIKRQNEKINSFDENYFNFMISKHWFKCCTKSSSLGPKIIFYYFRSDLRRYFNPGFNLLSRFIFKCIFKYKKGD